MATTTTTTTAKKIVPVWMFSGFCDGEMKVKFFLQTEVPDAIKESMDHHSKGGSFPSYFVANFSAEDEEEIDEFFEYSDSARDLTSDEKMHLLTDFILDDTLPGAMTIRDLAGLPDAYEIVAEVLVYVAT